MELSNSHSRHGVSTWSGAEKNVAIKTSLLPSHHNNISKDSPHGSKHGSSETAAATTKSATLVVQPASRPKSIKRKLLSIFKGFKKGSSADPTVSIDVISAANGTVTSQASALAEMVNENMGTFVVSLAGGMAPRAPRGARSAPGTGATGGTSSSSASMTHDLYNKKISGLTTIATANNSNASNGNLTLRPPVVPPMSASKIRSSFESDWDMMGTAELEPASAHLETARGSAAPRSFEGDAPWPSSGGSKAGVQVINEGLRQANQSELAAIKEEPQPHALEVTAAVTAMVQQGTKQFKAMNGGDGGGSSSDAASLRAYMKSPSVLPSQALADKVALIQAQVNALTDQQLLSAGLDDNSLVAPPSPTAFNPPAEAADSDSQLGPLPVFSTNTNTPRGMHEMPLHGFQVVQAGGTGLGGQHWDSAGFVNAHGAPPSPEAAVVSMQQAPRRGYSFLDELAAVGDVSSSRLGGGSPLVSIDPYGLGAGMIHASSGVLQQQLSNGSVASQPVTSPGFQPPQPAKFSIADALNRFTSSHPDPPLHHVSVGDPQTSQAQATRQLQQQQQQRQRTLLKELSGDFMQAVHGGATSGLSTSGSFPNSAYGVAPVITQVSGLGGLNVSVSGSQGTMGPLLSGSQSLSHATSGVGALTSPNAPQLLSPLGGSHRLNSFNRPSLDTGTLYGELYNAAGRLTHTQSRQYYSALQPIQLGSEDADVQALTAPHQLPRPSSRQPNGGMGHAFAGPMIGGGSGDVMYPVEAVPDMDRFFATPSQPLPTVPGLTSTGLTTSLHRPASHRVLQSSASDMLRQQAMATVLSTSALLGASGGSMRFRGGRLSAVSPAPLNKDNDMPLERLAISSQPDAGSYTLPRAMHYAALRRHQRLNSSSFKGARQALRGENDMDSIARSAMDFKDQSEGSTFQSLDMAPPPAVKPIHVHPPPGLARNVADMLPNSSRPTAASSVDITAPASPMQATAPASADPGALTTLLVAQLLAAGMDAKTLTQLQTALTLAANNAAAKQQHRHSSSHILDTSSVVGSALDGGIDAPGSQKAPSMEAGHLKPIPSVMLQSTARDVCSVKRQHVRSKYSRCEVVMLALSGLIVVMNAAVILYVLMCMRLVIPTMNKEA